MINIRPLSYWVLVKLPGNSRRMKIRERWLLCREQETLIGHLKCWATEHSWSETLWGVILLFWDDCRICLCFFLEFQIAGLWLCSWPLKTVTWDGGGGKGRMRRTAISGGFGAKSSFSWFFFSFLLKKSGSLVCLDYKFHFDNKKWFNYKRRYEF